MGGVAQKPAVPADADDRQDGGLSGLDTCARQCCEMEIAARCLSWIAEPKRRTLAGEVGISVTSARAHDGAIVEADGNHGNGARPPLPARDGRGGGQCFPRPAISAPRDRCCHTSHSRNACIGKKT